MKFCIWTSVWQILYSLGHSVVHINLPSKSSERLYIALWIQNYDLWRQRLQLLPYSPFPLNIKDLELQLWVLDHIIMKGCEATNCKLPCVLSGTRNWKWRSAFHYLSKRISFCGIEVRSLWSKSNGKVEVCISNIATGKPSKEREAWAQVSSPNTVCLLFNNCLM